MSEHKGTCRDRKNGGEETDEEREEGGGGDETPRWCVIGF